ncbi:hypothetical protein, variant [Aphanomyces invadans]|uniref:protein-tyrosine-phosphatase n=1 Tax=Aphanomyces invadans TaxID=157072 RepID=A0A024UH44_9STRA|nr:hypothetical protein, variant [Aphanomyces invadans]ETW05202.1 hypothetical protein, variant [Aphanomyces invadans]|eukprot:XP_008866639.1 hypothetical protein, variant [Aphanomyces invadans]
MADNGAVFQDEFDGEHDDEYEEVEEAADDMPMHISGRVYLGSIDAATNVSALKAKNITMLLSLLSKDNKTNLPIDHVHHHVRVDLEDDLESPLFIHLPFLVNCINEFLAREEDGNVLVHCLAGVSRSASAVAAYLMARDSVDANDALNVIRLSRPWVDPNPHFREVLDMFHRVLSHAHVPMTELAPLTLPHLHFHSSFVDPICIHQTKTLTIRLECDVLGDSKSHLASIYPFSTVVAVTDNASTPFAFLVITAIDHVSVEDLTAAHAQGEGLPAVADLQATLRQFYAPDQLGPGTNCHVYSFRLVTPVSPVH